MSKSFFLSCKGVQVGPFTSETILKKIEDQECQWTDYVYDESFGDWILLIEHPLFSGKVSAKPVAPTPQAKSKKEIEFKFLKDKEWFILKEGSNYGPFSPLEIIRLLQEKSLFEHDFVYHQKLESWKTISDVSDFSPENVRKYKDSGDHEVAEVFFKRRHVRSSYETSLLVHDNKKVYRGDSLEVSFAGAGIIVEGAHFEVGQTLYLHFKPGPDVPPFNAVCEVVSRQASRSQSNNEPRFRYGVKFTAINNKTQEAIKAFTSKAA